MHAWLLRAVILSLVVALTLLPTAHGQATVTAVVPATVRPGATARLELQGKELTDGLRVVTARPLAPVRIESIDPAKTKATAVIDVPADAIGPLGVWPATPAGPAALRTILIDDLPAVAASGTNSSSETAQTIVIPACIDGTMAAGKSAYYRFPAAAGQRVAIEAVTRQAGSMMDPVVRLLDASGRLLVSSDDGPTGPECRFRYVFTAAGDYTLELQANAHAGGMPYHLRIGDFPLVSHAVPLAVQRGVATRVGFGGLDAAAVPPIDVQATANGGQFLAAKLPGGRSSTWVPVFVHDAPQMREPPATAPLPIPVGVSGQLDAPGERDAYRIQGRAGQTLRFSTRGQSLGCGTVPQLRLVDAAGKVVAATAASANDQDPNAVLVLEPQLTFTFATDGDYRVEVNDLGRRGGPSFGYFFAVEPAGVDLELKPDPKARFAFAVEPGQGCAPVDLVVKRAGYEGEVTVSLAEPTPGLRVVNPLIPEKATQARVYLAADSSWSPQAMAVVRLVAQAGQQPARPVSTAALRAVHDTASTNATPVGDGGMLLAGVPGGAPRFELAPAAPVQLIRTGTTHAIPLVVKRLDPAFKGPVTIAGGLLPRGFSATSTMDKDTCLVTLTGAATPGSEPTSLRLLAVSDIGTRTALSVVDLPVTWTGTPSAPPAPPAAAIARAPGTKSPDFAADYAATIEALKPRVTSPLAKAAAPLNAKGTVQFADAGFATFSAGRLDGGGAPLGSSWSVSLWFMNSLDVNARAVTAYLFSRGPDGDLSGGDHLGIGGSFRPDMPGKLLVFNGNSRNSVVLGRSLVRPNEWHHVVMVRDGNRVRVFMDGAAQPEIDADVEPTAPGMGGFFFGARADNFAPLQGAMAHVAVFDRPLTAEETTRLHTAAIGRVPAAAPQASKNGDAPPPVQKAFEPDPPLPETATRPEAVTQAQPQTTAEPPQPGPQAPVNQVADAAPLGPGLHVYPSRITLDGARDRQQIAITTIDDAGFPCDWTRKARITVTNPAIATLRGTTLVPTGDGETEAIIDADGRRQSVGITVKNVGITRPVQFENDLMVALSKQTCSSGACHGSPSGKGGFRLSLRASEKQLDELTIIREELGRRINPIDPDASILLKKPLMQVPHGGGKQLALDDEAYAVMRAWIAEGGKVDPPNTPRCVRLEVSPAGRQVQRLAEGGRQIVATAHYADGSHRDVSHLVAYESSAMSVAAVDSHGWVTPKKRGETVILVRYLEHIELVPLMFIEEVPGFVWQASPENNEIDRLIDEKLRDLQYPPSAVCTDPEFVRRVFLDVIGMLPTVEETTAFLADTSPDKRSRLIDRLLEREEYARFSALKWGDILRMTKKHAGDQGVYKYHRWLEDAFRANKPHDQLARELLLGSGSTFDNPPANFYRTTADMNETVETVSQLFLGVRLQCAKCHNHPFDRWSQDNYYGLGAFFERVKKRKTPLADETFVFVAASGETKQPRTGKTVKPWLPKVGDIDTPAEADRREAFVTWLLAHDNPFFARVEANRIWSQFFARGIVHPVDEFRDSNPPSNGPLLDWLGAEFTKSGFDRKHLIRTILRSRTYQTSSVATPLNKADTLYFSHQLPRLLGAEQLLDAIGQVTGLEQQFGTLPTGTKATQLPAPDIAKLDFLKMLGQPERGTVCACERSEDSSLGMAIELFNGKVINAKLADPGSRFRTAVAAGTPIEDVIRELYVAAVCRQPTPEELAAAMAQCQAAKEPAQGVEDVCWALLNSDEFVFQH